MTLQDFDIKELALGSLVLVLLFTLVNPFDLYMLTMGQSAVLALLLAASLGFAGLFWRERLAQDEREVAHQALVGRVAYLFGAGVLLVAIVLQTLFATLDVALVVALSVMVLSKIIMGAYVRTRF